MNQITPLTPTDLIAVIIHVNAFDVVIEKHLKYFHIDYRIPDKVGFDANSGFAFFYSDFGGKKKYPSNLEILGEVTPDGSISFDVGNFIEGYGLDYGHPHHFKNYLNGRITTINRQYSFKTLLMSNGLYWDNPLGKYPERLAECDTTLQTLDWHRNKWKEAEDKCLSPDKKLIILQKIK